MECAVLMIASCLEVNIVNSIEVLCLKFISFGLVLS